MLTNMALRRRFSLEALGHLPSRISQLVPRGTQGLTVLSIDGRWLKLLHVTGPSFSRTVTTLIAHAIDGLSDEAILAWLRETCTAMAFEPGTVLVANPSQLTTTRLFTLPSTDPAEIRDIVELQAEKHTPYAKEEILTDFKILETDRTGYSRVLLILSHQDIVHRALRLVEGMGWVLERVGFELEGLVNWFRVSQASAPSGAVVVAEMDQETTTLVTVQGDKPYVHRSLAIGATHLVADPAEGPTKLIAEFQRSLETFEAEGLNITVSGVVLTGQAARFPDLKDRIQQSLELPTTVIAPFERYQLSDRALTEQDAGLQQVSFASLLGLAVASSEVDLTPKALKLHRAFEARARALVAVGCQFVGSLLLVSCVMIGKAMKDDRYRAWLAQEHQASLKKADAMEQLMEQVAVIQTWLKGRGQLLDVVADISKRTPPAIRWDSLTFVRGDQLVLKGISEEIPKVYDFAAGLRSSPYFTQVEARRVNKKKVGEENVTEFEVVCSFKAPGGSNEKAANPGG